MYRRDYVMRLIERFGLALRKLRDVILQRQSVPEDVRDQIQVIAEEAGLDLDVARRLDPATLLMWLAPTADVDEPRLWLAGELLYLLALQQREAGEAGWRGDMERAAAVFGRLAADWRPGSEQASAGERAAEAASLLQATMP